MGGGPGGGSMPPPGVGEVGRITEGLKLAMPPGIGVGVAGGAIAPLSAGGKGGPCGAAAVLLFSECSGAPSGCAFNASIGSGAGCEAIAWRTASRALSRSGTIGSGSGTGAGGGGGGKGAGAGAGGGGGGAGENTGLEGGGGS